MASLNKRAFRKKYNINKKYNIELTLALGYPNQTSKVIEMKDDVRYSQDNEGNLSVPKRELHDIILEV